MAKKDGRLGQLWCGLTTGHDFRETDITSGVLTAECVDCQFRTMIALSNETDRMFRAESRHLTDKILARGPSDYPVASDVFKERQGETIARFDAKAHAAIRTRGASGRFLPTARPITKSDIDRVHRKLIAHNHPRNRKGQFAKAKKK